MGDMFFSMIMKNKGVNEEQLDYADYYYLDW